MKIKKLSRRDQQPIDGSEFIKYHAEIETSTGLYNVNYQTDGLFHPHLTLKQFKDMVKSIKDSHLNAEKGAVLQLPFSNPKTINS
jgi:hypothetical protein